MSRTLLNVHEFDELAILPIKRQSVLAFVREEVGETTIYTFNDNEGKVGYFAIRPGTASSPWTHLEFYSCIPGKGVTTGWPAPRSILDKLEVADERGRRFLNVCRLIFAAFEGDHDPNGSDRRFTVWECPQQDVAHREGHTAKRQGGPIARTQIRASVFKRLKDENPTWSQAKVAIEAKEELGEYVTSDTVRNTYRAMGWKWERADRIR